MGSSISIHVTIVGDTNTGKSTLVSSYTGVDYRKERYHCMDMKMINTMHTIYENHMVYNICIHDTSGSSMKYFISMNSCNKSDAVIVCFDIHRPDSYKKAKQWIQDIQGKHTPIIVLVGTYKTILNPVTISNKLDIMDYTTSQHIPYHLIDVSLDRYAPVADIFSSILQSVKDHRCTQVTQLKHQTITTKKSKVNKKHTISTNDEWSNMDIDSFMDHHGLGRYTTRLKSDGYEMMSDLKDMSWQDLAVIDIMKTSHKKKLFRKLGKSAQIKATNIFPVRLMSLKGLNNDCEALNIKIIVLGDSGVGKTTLIKKLETNVFDANVSATIGVEHHFFKTLGSHRQYSIEVTIIDPSGMEKYRSMTHQSYRDVHGAILVTDISDKASWENIAIWTKELKENCLNDDIEIILLCNKMDKYMVNKNISDRIIKRAKTYSDHHKFRNYNTSSIDVEYGEQVRKAFEELVANIIYDNKLFRRLKKEEQKSVNDNGYGVFDSKSLSLSTIYNSPSIRVDGRLRSYESILPPPHHKRSSRCACSSLNEDFCAANSLNENYADV